MSNQALENIENMGKIVSLYGKNIYNYGIVEGVMLIRKMMDDNKDITIDMLKEICDEFVKNNSFDNDIPDMINESDKSPNTPVISDEDYNSILSVLDGLDDELGE